jgi:hypothetical protein
MKKSKNQRKLKELEKFVINEIEKYVKLHKKHEKDLRYIG